MMKIKADSKLVSFACGVVFTAALGSAYVWSVDYRWRCEAVDHRAAYWYWEPEDLTTKTIRWAWADDYYANHPQRLSEEMRRRMRKLQQQQQHGRGKETQEETL